MRNLIKISAAALAAGERVLDLAEIYDALTALGGSVPGLF